MKHLRGSASAPKEALTTGHIARIRRVVVSGQNTVLLRSYSLAAADQALVSASNFVLMVLLARALGPHSFGSFVVVHALLLFFNSVQGSLITQPHNVIGSTQVGEAYARYTRSTAIAQGAISCAFAGIIMVIGMGAVATEQEYGLLLVVLTPTSIAWQLQEYTRRVLYTQSDYKAVLMVDSLTYCGQIAGAVLLWQIDSLTAVSAILLLGIASTMGFTVGAWKLRTVLVGEVGWSETRIDLIVNWRFGRWLLGSVIAYWMSLQLYPLLVAGIIGPASAGGMRATQNIVAPTHIILKSMEMIGPVKGARLYRSNGWPGLGSMLTKLAIPVGILMAIYCVIVAVFPQYLVGSLLGEEYENYAFLVQIFALSYFLTYLFSVASTVLLSIEQTAPMFFANVSSAVITFTAGIWAVATFGLQGAMAGILIHGLWMNGFLWWCVFRSFTRGNRVLSTRENSRGRAR